MHRDGTRLPLLSVGIDTVRVAEVLESLTTHGTHYLDRVFTVHEQDSCTGSDADRARGLAARFAAKEATYKALRADDLAGAWTAVEVRRSAAGWCDIQLHGPALAHARAGGVQDLSVSLTHEAELATAVVVAVRGPIAAPAESTQGRSECPTT